MCEGVSLTLTKEHPINLPLQMEMTLDLRASDVRRFGMYPSCELTNGVCLIYHDQTPHLNWPSPHGTLPELHFTFTDALNHCMSLKKKSKSVPRFCLY